MINIKRQYSHSDARERMTDSGSVFTVYEHNQMILHPVFIYVGVIIRSV